MLSYQEELFLASSSPRRKDLLFAESVPVVVMIPRDIDETPLPDEKPDDLVLRLAALKAEEVSARVLPKLVLGADTIVCLGDQIFGKPADLDEAREMYRQLSGKTHTVKTGVALRRQLPQVQETWVSTTEVTFKDLDETAIEAALQLTNPLDKAGAYALQDQESILVSNVTGSRTNVIGLPVEEVVTRLKALQFLKA